MTVRDGDDEPDTSPESAAAARGAARTAASSAGKSAGRSSASLSTATATATATATTRGVVAGRLPVASRTAANNASKAATVMPPPRIPKISAPRPAPRAAPRLPGRASGMPKARADTVARASDRASKGFDVLDAALERGGPPAESSGNAKQKRTGPSQEIKSIMTPSVRRIASFGKVFVTNTVLGMAVFSAYEGIIENVAPSSVERSVLESTDDGLLNSNHDHNIPDNENIDEHHETDAMDRATLSQHFLAGALGGTAHALLSLAFETRLNSSSRKPSTISIGRTSYAFNNNPLLQGRKPLFRMQVPTVAYSGASILHHSSAHSALFGSYQLTKRALVRHLPSSDSANDSKNNGGGDAMHVAAIAVAGGLAGQFQHVTSHFTERRLGLAGDDTAKKQNTSSFLRRVSLASWPTWRSTMLAFPPSAIGFLAFEYGNMMANSGDDLVGGGT